MYREASDLSLRGDQLEFIKGKKVKKKYRMKKGLRRFLYLMLVLFICSSGYYLIQKNIHLSLALGAEPNKLEEQIQIIDTSKIYLYDPQFEKNNLLIQGTILDPNHQYKNSQYRVVGKELFVRIQVQSNPDKTLKEFGFKVPYDQSKIKKVYIIGPTESDKCLVLQTPE
ncbi:hypothetical protein JCM14036_26990 [Desulfotomaculum defluvii]